MFEIIEREVLAENIYRQRIKAPRIAKYANPGQFVIVRINEKGERIPLTIADFDKEKQTVDIVFMAIGKTTKQLATLGVGDFISDIVGPLGKPSDIEDLEKIVFIGGGIGVAPVYPQARAYKDAGVHVISIIGARSANILIWEDKMNAVSDELYITTDDGTKGHHGFVTQVLEKLLTEDPAIQRVVAIGPAIMMKMVAQVAAKFGVTTIVSLNSIMVDGTGMCGGCRVSVGGKTQFACVDGPEFDASQVNFDELMTRQRTYLGEEKESLDEYHNKQNKQPCDNGECPLK